MKKDQELTVITKTYDLILWSCNHTSKFPRNHRFVLGERIERNLGKRATIPSQDALDAAGVRRWPAWVRRRSPPHHELDRSCPARRHLSLAKRSVA